MESNAKKRNTSSKLNDENTNKMAKTEVNLEPSIQDTAQLLNEIVPDEKSLTIKLEFDDNPDSPLTSDCLSLSQIKKLESEDKNVEKPPDTPLIGDNGEVAVEYLDVPYISRADRVLNMVPITDEEEEMYLDLYDLMNDTIEYDWCHNLGSNECMYQWLWKPLPDPPEPVEKRKCNFSLTPGPIKDFSSYEAFSEIWDKTVLEHIVSETNKNALRIGCLKWTDTNIDEMYVFLAVTLVTNVYDNDSSQYWFSDNFTDSNVTKAMTYDRYVAINDVLSFSDVVDDSDDSKYQAIVSKIRPIITSLNKKFHILYRIGQDVVFDEPYQYSKQDGKYKLIKPKERIKEVDICDAKTGYVRNIVITSAKKDSYLPSRGISPNLILNFMKSVKDNGYTIYCDNIFNSALLARVAIVLRCNFVGTLRLYEEIDGGYANVKRDNLKDGEVSGASSDDVDFILWRDKNKNLISLVSTYHGRTTNEDLGRIAPAAFVDFKINVASLDKRDEILADYLQVEGKSWVRKMFERLLNISVYNSAIICNCAEMTPDSFRQFRLNLIQELIFRHSTEVNHSMPKIQSVLSLHESVLSLIEPISPIRVPIAKAGVSSSKTTVSLTKPERKAILPDTYWEHFPEEFGVVPGKKRQKIRKSCSLCCKPAQTRCPACDVPLCLFSCHKLYHSMLNDEFKEKTNSTN